MPSEKAEIIKTFQPFFAGTGGIDSWLSEKTPEEVFERLARIPKDNLSHAELNQLLTFSHEAAVTEDFFRYYWLQAPEHPYDVRRVEGFKKEWIGAIAITSLDHLRWGIYRLYIDAMLFFGNIRMAFRTLREFSAQQLERFYSAKRINPDAMQRRGAPAFPLKPIAKDSRYLISEMACKSYAENGQSNDLRRALLEAFRQAKKEGQTGLKIKSLLEGEYVKANFLSKQRELQFAADEILEDEVNSESQLEEKVQKIFAKFSDARGRAFKNTEFYLSLVNDLDVYVATSMRSRDDFRLMAEFCEVIFGNEILKPFYIRYFDPTLSAAVGHEDKGLIECLMVKCAKVLVWSAGKGESWGKDAEAAMALSLGKPVIFYCDEEQRQRFFRDIHPLSRLIDFQTGVAVGAIVASKTEEVSALLHRIFTNTMEYVLEQPKPGNLRLKEKLTGSCIRLQTSNDLLRETFWNYYHGKRTDI
jgi:hypothetical protein